MQSSKLHPGLVIWVNSKRLVESLGGFPPVPVEELLSDQTKATTRGLRHEDIAFRAAASGCPTTSAFLWLVDVWGRVFREVVSGVAEEHWRVAIDQRESSQESWGKKIVKT